MNLFFDLDGTLIDSRERLYKLFTDLTTTPLLSFDEYWRLKRAMFDHSWILKFVYQCNQEQIDSFNRQWLARIELPEYLALDQLFSYTIPTLKNLAKEHSYLITARQKYQNTIDQLRNLGILEYFQDVLVTEQKWSKNELVEQKGIQLNPNDIIMGDTGLDIKVGKSLGIKTYAVTSGFRNYEVLKSYEPDSIFNNIAEIIQYLRDDKIS